MNMINSLRLVVADTIPSPGLGNWFSGLTSTQKKVAFVASLALAAIAIIMIAVRCCTPPRRSAARYSPPSPQPYKPAPYNPQPYNPPSPPKPYVQPQPYVAPFPVGGHGVQGQNVAPPDNELLDLQEMETKIRKLREDLHNERKFLEVLQSQFASPDWDVSGIEDEKPDATAVAEDEPQIDDEQSVKVKSDEPNEEPDCEDKPLDAPQSPDQQPKSPMTVQGRPASLDQVDDEVLDDVDITPPSQVKNEQQSDLSNTEEKIFKMQEELDQALIEYPGLVRTYLEKKFSQFGKKDSREIFEHLSILSGLMDAFSDNKQFIVQGLEEIERFMANSLFTSNTEMCLQEEVKIDLIVFHEFISIANAHIQFVESNNPHLANSLKIKLANLPTTGHVNRKEFNKVYLDEGQQRAIMMNHFQQKESQALQEAADQIKTKKLSKNEAEMLAQCLQDNSGLVPANRNALRAYVSAEMGGRAPVRWDDASQILTQLNSYFTIPDSNPIHDPYNDPYYYNYGAVTPKTGIEMLHLTEQAKTFLGAHEIPRWYHATNYTNISPIVQSGNIKVMHRQAFSGAWVSTQREPSMGDCVLVFSHRIAKIDPNVFIGYEKGKVRWRGLQKPIPLASKKGASNLVIVGLSKNYLNQKSAVNQCLQRCGLQDAMIVSNDLVDFLQREVMAVIGNPNLTDKWWGKADAAVLEQLPQG